MGRNDRIERDDLNTPTPTGSEPIERKPRAADPGNVPPDEAGPVSLDPDRDDVERNAASGGWDGANEQIENDFETEQLRRREDADRG